MVLAQGDFQTLARKHEKFDVYELLGAWIIDSQNSAVGSSKLSTD